MKKQELLKIMDNELLEKLYGFSYARTKDSHEAQELCSDIVFALVRAAGAEGEITNPHAFLWRVARNVYADFSDRRWRQGAMLYEGDAEEVLMSLPMAEPKEEDRELLRAVYCRISFLTRAYRETMILFYLDGLSTAEIAKIQNTSETAVRQRLFSARNKIRNEVENMANNNPKPVALERIEYVVWGTGNPGWGDPREKFERQFSKHILRLCRQKPMGAAEIAAELNVPTIYVEEELEILTKGANGKYGFLRRLENGKYAVNIVLFDKETFEEAIALYTEQLPCICNVITDYIAKHREEYLAFPYLNKREGICREHFFNLILWQQIYTLANVFSDRVEELLAKKHFPQLTAPDRPFSLFGYVHHGKEYGGGWDGVNAEHVCGYAKVRLDNIYITRIRAHFHCGLNVAGDIPIQLALRAVDGLDTASLTEEEKEYAARAVACGYLYQEDKTLYTKILVNDMKDRDRLFDISKAIRGEFPDTAVEAVAEKLCLLIRKSIPDYLLPEWKFANALASMPVIDSLVESLIGKSVLVPPEDGVGAEGCWMSVMKDADGKPVRS